MKTPPLSSRDRSVLLIGGMIVVSFLVIGRGLPWLHARIQERRQAALVATQQATQTEWQVRNAAPTRRALNQVRRELAAYDSALVNGVTPSAASASLAALVSEAASIGDAQIGSIQLAADTVPSRDVLSHVTARLSASGDLMSIALMLQGLEQGPQLLAVRELNMVRSPSGSTRGQPESLQVELLVEGLYRHQTTGGSR